MNWASGSVTLCVAVYTVYLLLISTIELAFRKGFLATIEFFSKFIHELANLINIPALLRDG